MNVFWKALIATGLFGAFLFSCGGGSGSDAGRTASSGSSTKSKNETSEDTTTDDTTTTPDTTTSEAEFVSVTSGGQTFSIFKYEATIENGVVTSKKGAAPTVSINFADAKSACEKAGFRLCTETEWRAACRGPDNLLFGFSATEDGPPAVKDTCDVARTENNSPGDLPSNTGSFESCKTNQIEVYDMIGNASEWATASDNSAMAIGAAFYQPASASTCDAELNENGTSGDHMNAETESTDVGFRCCK